MSAHAKIILIGEHSVVYGKSAIALPLTNLNVTCFIEKLDGECYFESSYYSGLLRNAKNEPFYIAIYEALSYLNQEMKNLKFTLKSLIPAQRGLGSSAATSIALIKSIFAYFKTPISHDLLYELSFKAEKIAHENPSGIDCLLCASDVPYYFTKTYSRKIKSSLNAYLLICDSGIKGKTKEAIKTVAKNYDENHINLLHQYSEYIDQHYNHKYIKEIGKHLYLAHLSLKKLGISTSTIDEYVEFANNHCLGAKISGGGLGGCFIALCQSSIQAENLKSLLHQKGVTSIWIQKI